MEICVKTKHELEFMVSDTFDSKMLVPIMKNVIEKADAEWDDYNEVYHCCQLIEKIKKYLDVTMDFHYLKRNGDMIGVILVTYGQIPSEVFFPGDFNPVERTEKITMLNYFHVAPEGRGNGKYWLKDVILPYYREKGHEIFYVKSSHPKAFSLYESMGTCVGTYTTKSDNRLFERQGRIFRIFQRGE